MRVNYIRLFLRNDTAKCDHRLGIRNRWRKLPRGCEQAIYPLCAHPDSTDLDPLVIGAHFVAFELDGGDADLMPTCNEGPTEIADVLLLTPDHRWARLADHQDSAPHRRFTHPHCLAPA